MQVIFGWGIINYILDNCRDKSIVQHELYLGELGQAQKKLPFFTYKI
jgi:hypothetical protein